MLKCAKYDFFNHDEEESIINLNYLETLSTLSIVFCKMQMFCT